MDFILLQLFFISKVKCAIAFEGFIYRAFGGQSKRVDQKSLPQERILQKTCVVTRFP